MEFEKFCRLCRELEARRSRLAKKRLTADFLRQLDPDQVPWAVAFLAGRAFPASDPRDLEVSWGTLAGILKVMGPAQPAPLLSLKRVADSFAGVAEASGPGSRRIKIQRLGELFARGKEEEGGFAPVGKTFKGLTDREFTDCSQVRRRRGARRRAKEKIRSRFPTPATWEQGSHRFGSRGRAPGHP